MQSYLQEFMCARALKHFFLSQMLDFSNYQKRPFLLRDIYFSLCFKLGTCKRLSVEAQSHCYCCDCTMRSSSLASGSEASQPSGLDELREEHRAVLETCEWTLFSPLWELRMESCCISWNLKYARLKKGSF